MLRPIRGWVRKNDLSFCHVETPLTPAPPAGYPVFNSPPALARAIKATGFDACSTASNHSVDRGQAGIDATRGSLNRAKVRHTGVFSNPAPAPQTADPARPRRQGGAARLHAAHQRNPAPAPLVGQPRERATHPRRRQARPPGRRQGRDRQPPLGHRVPPLARRLPDEPSRNACSRSKAITAVVGQHAHVVQPIRRVGRLWVVFGEGNLLSNQSAACCPAASQDGMLVRLHLRVTSRHERVDADQVHADLGAPSRLRGPPRPPDQPPLVEPHRRRRRPPLQSAARAVARPSEFSRARP